MKIEQLERKAIDPEKLNAFLGRAVADLAASYGGVMVSLGRQLGLYRAMADAGPLSANEVAGRAGCAPRYVHEWLNSQVAGGYVHYHASSATYELLPEQAAVLADEESPTFMAPAWEVPASMWIDQAMAIDAFRTGEGVPWNAHDHRLFCGVAAFYRNAYRGQLVSEWLPALDGVVQQLESGIRVADVGCGHGHSTVIMAEAFPKSRFHGFDSHVASIEAARRNAAEAAVEERVHFEIASAEAVRDESFDLVCFFDCLHDMGDPVAALRRARASLAEGGSVMAVEPWAGDRLEENLGPVGQLYYAASTTLCTAHALSEEGGWSLGAQAGESRLREVFVRAGFTRVERVLTTPFNMILQARP